MRNKFVSVICCIVICSTMSGCSFGDYILRENPGKAMEQYLETKYGEDFQLVSYQAENSVEPFWKKGAYGGIFTTDALPGVEIEASVTTQNNSKEYAYFCDTYQGEYHNKEFYDMVEKIYQNELQGEYYLYTMSQGDFEGKDYPIQGIEEYSQNKNALLLCLLVNEGSIEEEAISATQKVISQMKESGIKAHYEIYINRDADKAINEVGFVHLENGKEQFDVWAREGLELLYEMDYDGTENNVRDILGDHPGLAMEQYLETKYGEDFQLLSYHNESDFDLLGREGSFGAEFSIDKLPNVEIKVATVIDMKGKEGTKMYDTYQSQYHNKEFNEIAQNLIKEEFSGDYYVQTRAEVYEEMDAPFLELSAYTQERKAQFLTLLINEGDMDHESIIAGIEKVISELDKQGIRAYYDVYLNHDLTKSSSEAGYSSTSEENSERFEPWFLDNLEKLYERDFEGKVIE